MVVQVSRGLEAVVEDLGQPAAPRERHEAVPHVTGRRDPKLLAQSPAGTPIVGHRDDGRKVPDPIPQTTEQHRQPRTAAERHDLHILETMHGDRVYRPPEVSSRKGFRARALR